MIFCTRKKKGRKIRAFLLASFSTTSVTCNNINSTANCIIFVTITSSYVFLFFSGKSKFAHSINKLLPLAIPTVLYFTFRWVVRSIYRPLIHISHFIKNKKKNKTRPKIKFTKWKKSKCKSWPTNFSRRTILYFEFITT